MLNYKPTCTNPLYLIKIKLGYMFTGIFMTVSRRCYHIYIESWLGYMYSLFVSWFLYSITVKSLFFTICFLINSTPYYIFTYKSHDMVCFECVLWVLRFANPRSNLIVVRFSRITVLKTPRISCKIIFWTFRLTGHSRLLETIYQLDISSGDK